MKKLNGCRVVEGYVHILLIDEAEEDEFRGIEFKDLVEITGYLLLYRLSGIKSLYSLFPNLAVIRGQEVYNDYALVIYEFKDLEEIGLINLQTIQRGSVRIEKNDKLCYAEMIEWSLIAGHSDHYIAVSLERKSLLSDVINASFFPFNFTRKTKKTDSVHIATRNLPARRVKTTNGRFAGTSCTAR